MADHQPGDSLRARTLHAVDLYRRGFAPRIIFTGGLGTYTPTEAEVAAELAASGISGAGNIVEFTYYTNDMDTTNEGVEVVAAWDYNWGDLGTTSFQGSWAWMDQEIDKVSIAFGLTSNGESVSNGKTAMHLRQKSLTIIKVKL